MKFVRFSSKNEPNKTPYNFTQSPDRPKITKNVQRWDWKWQDNVRYKKPTRLPAPEYIFELMNWVERELNDDELFPLSSAEPWPRDFMRRIQRIFTRLHRVFVHVYYSHFRRIQEIAGEAQVILNLD